MAVKAFNRWGTEGIVIEDPGLKRYVVLQPRIVPKTGARYAGHKFHKSRIFVVERLINKLMVAGHKGKKHYRSSGHQSGKSARVYAVVENAFQIIEKRTKENPMKVFIHALQNAAPREEIVSIEYGGARYPKAVECGPQRRVDVALRYFVQGAFANSFKKKRPIADALADEIMAASRSESKSHGISKKLELERQADGSR